MNLHDVYLSAQLAKNSVTDDLTAITDKITILENQIVILDSMADFDALIDKTAEFYFIKEEEE